MSYQSIVTMISGAISWCCLVKGETARLDAYGGFTDIVGERTGFFHPQKINNRWWLVTPDGHGFWGVGISHPVTGFSKSTVNFAYQGDQRKWLEDSIKRMRDLGYNCVWTGPYSPERLKQGYVDKEIARKVFREARIPYTFPLPITRHQVEMRPGDRRPDVFGDEYSAFLNDLIEEFVPSLKDDPWVIGYYYGFAPWTHDHYWLNDIIARKGSPGRARLIEILEERYDDIESFNGVYETECGSFEQLKAEGEIRFPEWPRRVKMGFAKIPSKPGSQEIYDDVLALFEEIVVHTHKIAYEAIRKHDPNHLIFGWYVKETTYTEEIWERIAPYIDVLSPQHVSSRFPIGKIVEKLDKPALISDQPFGNVYPLQLVTAPNSPGAVPDHVDRLVLYDLLANRISSDPNFIGVDFCSVLFDQSHEEKAYEVGQPGLFTVYGEPKPMLNRIVSKYNRKMTENLREPKSEAAIEELNQRYHDTIDRYRQVMRERRTFLMKNPVINGPR